MSFKFLRASVTSLGFHGAPRLARGLVSACIDSYRNRVQTRRYTTEEARNPVSLRRSYLYGALGVVDGRESA